MIFIVPSQENQSGRCRVSLKTMASLVFFFSYLILFKNGVFFYSLFQSHPEVQDAFLPFQQLAKEDMQHSDILRSHALRVMGTVDKCLTRIRTLKKLQHLMHELGERHIKYNAQFEFIDVRNTSNS